MRRFLALLTLIFGIPGVQPEAMAKEPLRVVASFSILADLAEQVGGEDVTVRSLVPPDGDAHTYQARPSDAEAIAKADLVLVNGLGFEGWIDRLITNAKAETKVVTASDGIPILLETIEDGHNAEHSLHHPHAHSGEHDPHAWQNLANARVYAKNITAAFKERLPDKAAAIEARAAALVQELTALENEARASFSAIPAEKRVVVSGHDAFRYFADAYDVRFVAPAGLSTASEPSAKHVAEIVQFIRKHQIAVLFPDGNTSPKLLQQMAAESGAKIGEKLYADALSGPDGPASTFLMMYRHNLNLIHAAMQRKALD